MEVENKINEFNKEDREELIIEYIKKEAKTQGFYGQLLQTINHYPKWKETFFQKLQTNSVKSVSDLNSYLQKNDYFRNKVDLEEGTFIDDEEVTDIVITKDNIADYYEFMSDEDKNSHSELIHKTLIERQFEVFKQLGVDVNNESVWKKLQENYIEKQTDNKRTEWTTDFKIFGVKDTLEPIDEYIEDIKASKQYNQYINSTTLKIDKKLDSYLLKVGENTKVVFISTRDATAEDFSNLYKNFVKELKEEYDWTDVESYRLFEDQKFSNVYYLEDYCSDGLELTLIKMDYNTDAEVEKALKHFKENRDLCRFSTIDGSDKQNTKSVIDSSPTIDECLQQIEEEEAAKQNIKSPSL